MVWSPVGTSSGSMPPPKINWARCVICQVDKDEPLQCPANSKCGNVGVGSLADPGIWNGGGGPVSYTHLTLPTNREV